MTKIPDQGADHGRAYLLDALRGVAALAVVLFHLHYAPDLRPPSAWLAVDFFFLLSGYVVALAYERRLRQGRMSATGFILARLTRLYPLYLLGLVLGLGLALYAARTGHVTALTPGALAGNVLANLAFLPWPGQGAGDWLFPLNVPMWSLMSEMAVNLLFLVLLIRLPTGALAGLVALAFAVHAWGVLTQDTGDLGATVATLAWNPTRTLVSFGGGMLLFRLIGAPDRRPAAVSLIALPALFGWLCLAPGTWAAPFALVSVALVFPALVGLGARVEVPHRARPLATALGDLSYPVYILHYPLIGLLGVAFGTMGLSGLAHSLAVLLVIAILSALAARADARLRAALVTRLRRRGAARDPA